MFLGRILCKGDLGRSRNHARKLFVSLSFQDYITSPSSLQQTRKTKTTAKPSRISCIRMAAVNGTSPKVTLYTNHGCPFAHRAHITIKELGLEHEEVVIDLTKPRDPWYLDINPVSIPALSRFLQSQSIHPILGDHWQDGGRIYHNVQTSWSKPVRHPGAHPLALNAGRAPACASARDMSNLYLFVN